MMIDPRKMDITQEEAEKLLSDMAMDLDMGYEEEDMAYTRLLDDWGAPSD